MCGVFLTCLIECDTMYFKHVEFLLTITRKAFAVLSTTAHLTTYVRTCSAILLAFLMCDLPDGEIDGRLTITW